MDGRLSVAMDKSRLFPLVSALYPLRSHEEFLCHPIELELLHVAS